MGWAQGQIVDNVESPTTVYVTANLSVNFRAPLPERSEVIIHVFHGGREGRKIRFGAVMESYDGRSGWIVYCYKVQAIVMAKCNNLQY
jgi:hypothetical protein